MKDRFLAFDIGAESGRALAGTLAGGRLAVTEVHRFANGIMPLRGRYHWNLFRLFEEVLQGLRAAAAAGGGLAGIGVDTWGVDFCLLGDDGSILGLPYAYRDPHTLSAPEEFYRLVPEERLYALTGLQELPFNTLFQLHALRRDGSSQLAAARDLLFMPDAFNYMLTGVRATEHTIASTSQLYDTVERQWIGELCGHLGLDPAALQRVLPAGSAWGELTEEVATLTGLGPVPVLATASHDTAAAVAAVPASGRGWCYISCGTWSLVGVELDAPLRTGAARIANFTNEGGLGGTTRFLRNVMGLWLLQECRRAWADRVDISYGALVRAAGQAPPFRLLIDPDWPGFLNPREMNAAIGEWCRLTGQEPPASPAATTRAILEGLALKYRFVIEEMERVLDRELERIHMVGGGSRNDLLCSFTAAATGREVLAGPAEATAVGNLLVQALARGRLGDPAELRRVVATSFPVERYAPAGGAEWDRAYARFQELREGMP